VEIGIPFSDPLADGPAIQRSSEIALAGGATLARALAEARAFHSGSTLPLVIMSYANPVLAYGVERFAADASAAGISGVILSDLPPEERPDVWAALAAHGLDAILLVAPTTAPARRTALAQRAHGFVYVLARTGVTGAASALGDEVEQVVTAVRAASDVPVAIGFGVSDAERAREVARIADAVIVGSALVERLEAERSAGLECTLEVAERFVSELARAVESTPR
jgi:tryptophan synthase alpha chain